MFPGSPRMCSSTEDGTQSPARLGSAGNPFLMELPTQAQIPAGLPGKQGRPSMDCIVFPKEPPSCHADMEKCLKGSWAFPEENQE